MPAGGTGLQPPERFPNISQATMHCRYVTHVAWAAGDLLVSGSWDQSLCVHKWMQGSGGKGGSLDLVHREAMPGQVTALAMLPGGDRCLVAVRGSNYLRRWRLGSAGDVAEEARLNLNATGDDHVSFSAVHLTLSSCQRFVLVSADTGRLLMYAFDGDSEHAGGRYGCAWRSAPLVLICSGLLLPRHCAGSLHQVRAFYGIVTEKFHQFGAAFDASGSYVLVAAAHGSIQCYAVSSAKAVTSWRAHDKNVRGLCYDPKHRLLLTCSFDRTVKAWGTASPD